MDYSKIIFSTCAAVFLSCNVSAQSGFSTSGLEGEPRSAESTLGDGVVLTQSTDPTTIVPANSVACTDQMTGLHTDNSYLRRFDLDGEFSLTEALSVDSVDVGVETATSGTGGDQPISVIVYSVANADPLLFANLTEVGRVDTVVADTTQSIVNFPVNGSPIDPATDDLVIEVFTPNGQDVGHSFFIGSNNAGESAPSYLAAADCGINEPTTTTDIGFPQMQIVMSVLGTLGSGPPGPTAESIPTLSKFGIAIMLMMLAGVGFVAIRRMA